MSNLNWGMIQDGGTFESLMHAILYAEDAGMILFGRPGKDAGQDARSSDGAVVYQAKYRQGLTMERAVSLALEELKKINRYRQATHDNHRHWQNACRWILAANFNINPNDEAKWQEEVVPSFRKEGLKAEYWSIEKLEGKLTELVHIREVFFEGENRVLGGLKEAYDLLSADCIGSISLDKPMVGRETEIQAVSDFTEADDKRVLPVVGVGGIGKSRLLYESLIALTEKKWRVFWAIPGTMARSSQWFRLLNGNQPTCVVIDDPDDPGLLRVVIEQLAMIERRNWKVIISYRSEKTHVLLRFKTNNYMAEPVRLEPLNELLSKKLIQAILNNSREEAWLHKVYKYAKGVPGWLSLIAESANRGSMTELHQNADDVAIAYVDACLDSLGPTHRDEGQKLLRWFALWGTLGLDDNDEQEELQFLDGMSIPVATTRDLLSRLVCTGLVRNWGARKRLYAVEPLLIRESVLCEWLLLEENGTYRVNPEGKRIIDQIVKGTLPALDRTLGAVSHLTLARLEAAEGFSFLKPFFDAMTTLASEGTVLDQYRIIDLIEKAGASDPESALDVLIAIRENPKDDVEVEVPSWGRQTVTYASVVLKLSSILFHIAECVSDTPVSKRCLTEFQSLITLEKTLPEGPTFGSSAHDLLKRLLRCSKNSRIYAQPAKEIVEAKIHTSSSWPFVGILLESLLDPEREYTESTANWTITFVKTTILPGGDEWNVATALRLRVLEKLRTSTDSDLRSSLWQILSWSHKQFHRMLHGFVKAANASAYRSVLVDDLTACVAILKTPPVLLTIEEATHARVMWSWYLEYGRSDDPVDLAHQCEQVYNDLSKWGLHRFFRFRSDDELEPETQRISKRLKAASDIEIFNEFFAEAKRYLMATRGLSDGADWARVSVLANSLAELFRPKTGGNVLTSYVMSILDQSVDENELAWHFAVRICKNYLCEVKKESSKGDVGKELRQLLALCRAKERLLFDLYSDTHPVTTGPLMLTEMDCVLEYKSQFKEQQWVVLLGTFAMFNWETVESHLRQHLESLKDSPAKASEDLKSFISSLHISSLRYKWFLEKHQTACIIDLVVNFGLDGSLFAMHEMKRLREKCDFKFTMSKTVVFIHSRIQLEEKATLGDSFDNISHDFHINEWCSFDETDLEERNAFQEFCSLALGSSAVALFWMPRFIAQLEPSGHYVRAFVEQYLRENPDIDADKLDRVAYLASAYAETSEAWAAISLPICQKGETVGLRREEREHVYFCLSSKQSGVIGSMPGEVADYYIQTHDEAVRMRDAEPNGSPLRDYWAWTVRWRLADLRLAQGRAEELADG